MLDLEIARLREHVKRLEEGAKTASGDAERLTLFGAAVTCARQAARCGESPLAERARAVAEVCRPLPLMLWGAPSPT